MLQIRNWVLGGACALAVSLAQAATEVVGNLRWTFDINASKTVTVLEVERAKGAGKVNTLTIPDTLGGRAVTCVGEWFWPDLEGVTTLVLGDNVTDLEDGVFAGYEDLKSVTGGKNLRRVGYYAFEDTRFLCGDKYIDWSFTEEEEEAYFNGLELVYVGTFVVGRRGELANCEDEEFWSVYYDEEYGDWVESWDWSYRLNLKAGTTGIANGVFADLPITDVALPDSVAMVGNEAFAGCCYLKSLSFGSGLREIGEYAFCYAGEWYRDEVEEVCFYKGPGITKLVFPGSLERIGTGAFEGFGVLKYVDGLRDNVQLGEDDDPESVFGGTYYLEGWVAPRLDCDGRTVWGYSWDWGFDDGCVTNGVLTIPAGVTTIDDWALEDFEGISEVVLPPSLKTIGEGSFSYCYDLKTVTGGAGLERVGCEAFYDTRFLRGDKYFDGFETWEEEEAYWRKLVPVYAGTFCVGHRGGLEQAWDDEYYSGDYESWKWSYTLTFKAGTTGIADEAFSELPITGLVLPDSVRFIGDKAFEWSFCLQSITFGKGLERIGEEAFLCAGEDVADIASKRITSLTFPSSLVSLGEYAFLGCYDLETVTFEGDAPKYGEGCFEDNEYKDVAMTVVVYDDTWGWPSSGYWHGFPLTFVDRPEPPEAEQPGGAGDGAGSGASAGGGTGTPGTELLPDVPPVPEADIVGAVANAKAMTVRGVVLDGLHVVGSVEIAVGKPGAKGTKLAGSVTLFGGKKLAAKAPNADLASGAQTVVFAVKDLGAMTLKVGAQADGTVSFTGTLGSYVVTSGRVGGETVAAATFGLPEGFAAQLQGGAVNADLLPDGLPVQMNGKKWLCPKTGTVAYKKDKTTGQMAWVLNGGKDDPAKTNFAALKLNYAPKTGAFKGSFKAYSLVGGKLKKTTVALAGVLVDGSAFGTATVKKVGSWRVVVE